MANRTYEGRRDVLHTIENSAGGTVVSSYTYAVNPISQRTSVTTASIAFAGSNSIVECSLHPSAFTLHHSFSWGLDLSGTMQGAGGVGGLLATRWSTGAHFFPTYAGNGSVSDSLATNGGATVHYEYDPFGNLTRLTGSTSTRFSFRFSTKPRDPATGLYYYGYRWYEPYTGRWINRDPIEERGGVNLYGFVLNSPNERIDAMGLNPQVWTFSGIHSYNKNYPDNDRFEPYVDSKLRGLEYPAPNIVRKNTALWPGFVGAHVNFVSRSGIRPDYAWPFDQKDYMIPFAENTLDQEAAGMAKWLKPGAFCGGARKKKIKAILFAPKTDTLPDQGCCDIQFVVYWSEKDRVPNQGPGNDLVTARESQEFWSRWGGEHTYNVDHGDNDGFFSGQHGLDGFIDGKTDDLIEGGNPFDPRSRKAPHPVNDYIRPWYRGDQERNVDYIFIGHSQGTNIMMHVLKRACCIGGQK